MQITFLGTGGGRVNLIKQLRGTGGFLISGSANIYVDPGPGALLSSIKYGIDLATVNALVITHNHIDHMNDAALVIEAMTGYAMDKKGMLFASKFSLEGGGNFDRALSRYHLSLIPEKYLLESGKTLKIKQKKKDGSLAEFELEGIKTKHDETSAFGFKLRMDGKVIGYTSDTEFFADLPELWKGCDILIVNNLKPMHDGIPDHLASEDTVKILKVAQPKLAILSHIGMKLIKEGPEFEAERITSESGVHTIAARDGMIIDCKSLAFSMALEKKQRSAKPDSGTISKLSDFEADA